MKLKSVECRQFLEYLYSKGSIDLPDRCEGRAKGVKNKIARTYKGEVRDNISGKVKEFSPLVLCRIKSKVKLLLRP